MAKENSGTARPETLARSEDVELVSPLDLQFDPENPRLVDFLDEGTPTQDELALVLWENMAIDELVMSISASGFFPYEPLIAIKKKRQGIVIEGNRRLAALKLLLDSGLRKRVGATGIPRLTSAQRQQLSQVPVIWTTRSGAWNYIGFKHVNGPVKWDSYSKAEYIARVHNEFRIPLKEIARQIGDTHRIVQRLYRALMVIQQAERAGKFDRSQRYRSHFSFSHLYTGLDYEGISTFLNVKPASVETRSPVPRSKLNNLAELCVWLYGDKTRELSPVVQSQNPHLRQLDEVVQNKSALLALRERMPLSVALEISYGDEAIFRRSLVQAKDALQKARATLSTGFEGDRSLLELANQIAELAYDLSVEMDRKTTRRRRPQRKSKTG